MAGRKIMGLASGKSKLKLIDIDATEARTSGRRRSPTLGAGVSQNLDQDLPQDPALDLTQDLTQDPAGAFVRDAKTVEQEETTEIGATLRRARERSGQSLGDASRNLRIRMAYLAALEDGDFKALPGMTYAIGYVRTYAQYLDLDVEKAIVLFKAEASDLNGPRQLVFPSPAPEGKVPGGALMFVAAFLAIFAYAGWYHVTDSGRAVAGYSLEVPEVLQSWLDQPSTGAASDGFTTAAIAASPPATDDISPVPSISVPLSETTVLNITPTTEEGITVTLPVTEPSAVSDGIGASNPSITATTDTMPATAGSEALSSTSISQAPALQMPNETSRIVAKTEPASETVPTSPAPRLVASPPMESDDVPVLVTGPSRTVAPEATSEASQATEHSQAQEVAAPQTTAAGTPSISIPSAPAVSRDSRPTGAAFARQAADTKPTRVVIKASAASWVQVRASDATTIMTKVMRAGDVYEVPDRDGLKLFTGNAGALTILIDGKAVPSIGGNGDIARDIDLAPDSLEKRVN
jgi:cytoskeleton protein RodZ